jgi:hypothetical protein
MERLERAREAASRGLATAVGGGSESRARAGLQAPLQPGAPEADAAAPASDEGSDGGGAAAPLNEEAAATASTAFAAEAAAGPEAALSEVAGVGCDEDYTAEDYAEGELEREAIKAPGVLGVLARARSAAAKGLAVAINGRDADEDAAAAEAEAAAAEAAAAAAGAAAAAAREPAVRKFPRGFMWGTATSAYQIEGGYLDEGKGLSIWDAFAHAHGRVRGGGTGDVAACHYYRWEG